MMMDQMTTNTNQEKTVIEAPKMHSHYEVHDALLHTQDLLERSQLKFMLFGNTAKALMEHELPMMESEGVHLGIMRKDYTKSGASTFESLSKTSQYNGDHISYEYKDVPVRIDIIDNDYTFFKNPESKFYYLTEYLIPNPFSAYWEKREEIK